MNHPNAWSHHPLVLRHVAIWVACLSEANACEPETKSATFSCNGDHRDGKARSPVRWNGVL
jgi:hypothetical protein